MYYSFASFLGESFPGKLLSITRNFSLGVSGIDIQNTDILMRVEKRSNASPEQKQHGLRKTCCGGACLAASTGLCAVLADSARPETARSGKLDRARSRLYRGQFLQEICV